VEIIDVPIRASARLGLLLAATHAAAIVAVIAMPVAWWLRLAGCSLLLISGTIMVYRSALLKASDSVVGLQLRRDGSCELRLRNQRPISGSVCPRWFASPLMIVVQVACPGQRLRRSIALLPDAADADTLRRLRIFLRFAIEPSGRNK
jgi:toxin CptA